MRRAGRARPRAERLDGRSRTSGVAGSEGRAHQDDLRVSAQALRPQAQARQRDVAQRRRAGGPLQQEQHQREEGQPGHDVHLHHVAHGKAAPRVDEAAHGGRRAREPEGAHEGGHGQARGQVRAEEGGGEGPGRGEQGEERPVRRVERRRRPVGHQGEPGGDLRAPEKPRDVAGAQRLAQEAGDGEVHTADVLAPHDPPSEEERDEQDQGHDQERRRDEGVARPQAAIVAGPGVSRRP